jgi:hypothetical protein
MTPHGITGLERVNALLMFLSFKLPMAVEPARAHSKMGNDAPHFIMLGF